MNRSEAALVLAKIQAYDNRTVGEATVNAWAESLADVNYQYALDAVALHYRDETAWIMPAHVQAIVKDRAFRLKHKLRELGGPDFPPDLTWGEEQRYREEYNIAILQGKTRDEAHNAADFIDMYNVSEEADARRAAVKAYRAVQRGEVAPAPKPRELEHVEGLG